MRVVISGLGHVGAAGDVTGLGAALRAGSCSTAQVARGDGSDGEQRALLVTEGFERGWLEPSAARRMSRLSRLAVTAARMAARSAACDSLEGEGTATFLATTFAAVAQSRDIVASILGPAGPVSVSPFAFTESVANAPAAQVAIDARARGANVTIVAGPAGALLALARGAADIRRGRARQVLAGVVDEMLPVSHAALVRFGDVARPGAAGRPFDAAREGYVAAEGATMVVLESEEDARRRDAPILARVAGAGSAFEPGAARNGWAREPSTGASISAALATAGFDHFDLVVSGASGSRAGDHFEGRLLRSMLGHDACRRIVAPKGLVGEYGGGFLASACLLASGQQMAATSFDREDPEVGIVPLRGTNAEVPARTLVTCAAAGGGIAWLVLERP